jgi:hypothetical protein
LSDARFAAGDALLQLGNLACEFIMPNLKPDKTPIHQLFKPDTTGGQISDSRYSIIRLAERVNFL